MNLTLMYSGKHESLLQWDSELSSHTVESMKLVVGTQIDFTDIVWPLINSAPEWWSKTEAIEWGIAGPYSASASKTLSDNAKVEW